MPLVLTENEETESGIRYEDRTGISYQYPKLYRRIIQPGELFVYYRGRKRHGGGRALQVYFGTGVIGAIRPDDDRLVCEVLDYTKFEAPVPFKNEAGRYYESGAERRGYFQRGVRVISSQDFQKILDAASQTEVEFAPAKGTINNRQASFTSYAAPANIARIEEFAMEVALEELRRRYPEAKIQSQPRNNPGFDILVSEGSEQIYVEVKGTGRQFPGFFITNGEIQFSRRQGNSFRLLVVYDIDSTSRGYRLLWHQGEISDEVFDLRPVQWTCRLKERS